MMKKLTIFSFLLILLCTGAVYANEAESVLLSHNNVEGYWFPPNIAGRMLQDLEELPLLRQKTVELELKIKTTDEYILLFKEDIKITEEISNKWKSAFETQVKISELERDRYDKWYKSSVLWFSVGFIAASLAAVGLNFGLAKAQ